MIKLYILGTLLAIGTCVSAQVTERIVVRAGEDIGPAVSPNGHYRFARFTEGVVTMKNGSRSRAHLNFHIFKGEMQFIGSSGDTLAIAQADFVDNINIGTHTKFIYSDKVCYELIGESTAGKLGKRIKVLIANDKKSGFGQTDATGSNVQISDVQFDRRAFTLAYDVELRKTTTYYWVDSKNNVLPATRKNSMKLVEKGKQAKLQAFIEQNNTNFNSEEDLGKLLTFAATL
jgi:hypothetical protein